jgi:hypothetical protein
MDEDFAKLRLRADAARSESERLAEKARRIIEQARKLRKAIQRQESRRKRRTKPN